jgi:putative ABC transport system substrate-binding protein
MRMGWVLPGGPEDAANMKRKVFWDRLRVLGWEEGRNLEVEQRYAHGHTEAFPGFMEEMVRQKVDVIVTASTPGALAARSATDTIPIVVQYMTDPVGTGLASSLAHPGGNLTGMSYMIGAGIPGKWLELLGEIVPKLSTVAILSNADNPIWRMVEEDIGTAAVTKDIKTVVFSVHAASEIEGSLQLARRRAQAIIVVPDGLFIQNYSEVVAAVTRLRLPAIYGFSNFVTAGGLMSYGPDPAEAWGHAAVYVDKIPRGAKAGELPIVQPAQFSLVVNLKTAKALGITIPQSILLRADEVIK